MAIYSLIFLIIVFSLLIVRTSDKYPLLLFIVPAAIFQMISHNISGGMFHIAGASLDLFVIIALTMLRRANVVTLIVGAASLVSVFLNVLGWIMYEKGFSSIAYDTGFTIIYLTVLYTSAGAWWNESRANSSNPVIRSNSNNGN